MLWLIIITLLAELGGSDWLVKSFMGGEGEYLLLGLGCLETQYKLPHMKSTHMYGIVLSFLLAVFLSQPLYSNKKMATCRLALWSVVLRSYLYYKERKCKGQRKGTVLDLYGLGSVASFSAIRTCVPGKSRKFINTKIKIGKYTG